MLRTCEEPHCQQVYDDLQHSTICPHEKFDMCCTVSRPNPRTGKLETMICTSYEQMVAFMKNHDTSEGN